MEEQNESLEKLIRDKHINFLLNLDKQQELDAIGYFTNEYLKMSAAYWCFGSLLLLNYDISPLKEKAIEFIFKCYHENGGFSGNIGHDPNITTTHYAILCLSFFNSITLLDIEKTSNYIANLQNEDGSFKFDEWGETDTRFSYCALSSLKLLNKIHKINLEKAVEFVISCKNIDEGFGGIQEAESHAAYGFCGIGALAIAGRLDLLEINETALWIAKRQIKEGGFNGRPEKLADVCYSWWAFTTICILDKDNYINKEGLKNFILKCQDSDKGGIGDREGNEPDVFHTFFGLAGLSLLKYEGLAEIDKVYAIPKNILKQNFSHIEIK